MRPALFNLLAITVLAFAIIGLAAAALPILEESLNDERYCRRN